ncbi:MAG: DUF1841 family protein [Thiohalospira sp.]
MFGQDRDEIRQSYLTAWQRAQAGEALDPTQRAIADVVADHPEYQTLLSDPETALARDYTPEQGETNPFLHMGLHLALREQVGTDRPTGIRPLHARLAGRLGDEHEAEHRMMECLGQALWEAQRSGRAPDEAAYLECLKGL